MGKRWIDASNIKMVHEIKDDKLRELDIEMRKKPNFDKGSSNDAGKYKSKERSLIKCKRKNY